MIFNTILTAVFSTVFSTVFKGMQTDRVVPSELRRYFYHLIWDIAWMGIVAGSGQAFLGVYVARLGADPLQMGLLNAGPALVGLLFAMPTGLWLRNRPVGNAVAWSAILSRAFFLGWVLLPRLLPAQAQIWSYISLVLLMTMPATVLAIGFNALYAAAVPPEWRGYVVSRRNAIFSLIFVITSLVSGAILDRVPQPLGYEIIFGLGFIGAVMSTYHLWHLRTITTATIAEPEKIRTSLGDYARPGDVRMSGMNLRTNIGLRAFTRGTNLLRIGVLRGSYGKVLAALFAFHFAQYMPIPVFPLFWVEVVQFSDWEIGFATASFHLAVLLGSLRFAQLTDRWGNHTLTWAGAILLGTYPIVTAFSTELWLLVATSMVGGLAWSMVGGALGNYLLDQIPENERPAHLAWYNMALNAAVLTGSLGGSLLAGWIGLMPTLLLAGLLRMLAGVALWRWR